MAKQEGCSGNKKGKKGGKGRRMGGCFSFLCVWRRWREPATTWLSFLSLFIRLSTPVFFLRTFLSLFVPPAAFHVRDTRVPLSLLRRWKASPARTQLSGLCGWQSLRRHLARCNAAVPHCSCSVPVHVSRPGILAVHKLSSAELHMHLKTCDATQPRENGLIVACVPALSQRPCFSLSFPPFRIFWAFSPIFFSPPFCLLRFFIRFLNAIRRDHVDRSLCGCARAVYTPRETRDTAQVEVRCGYSSSVDLGASMAVFYDCE